MLIWLTYTTSRTGAWFCLRRWSLNPSDVSVRRWTNPWKAGLIQDPMKGLREEAERLKERGHVEIKGRQLNGYKDKDSVSWTSGTETGRQMRRVCHPLVCLKDKEGTEMEDYKRMVIFCIFSTVSYFQTNPRVISQSQSKFYSLTLPFLTFKNNIRSCWSRTPRSTEGGWDSWSFDNDLHDRWCWNSCYSNIQHCK